MDENSNHFVENFSTLAKNEIERIKEFSSLAENEHESDIFINDIIEKFELNKIKDYYDDTSWEDYYDE